ncbi:MAG: lysylphosphatidylglycerol synthase transmembrane domain-containing protein [Kofleriaceae bacterium]
MANKKPTWAKWVTRISLVFAIGALVWTVNDLGLNTMKLYMSKIGWWWFGVVGLEVFGTFLDAVAIRAFMSPENREIKLRQTTLSQLSGRAVNIVTPTANLGEVLKMSVLTEYVSEARAISTILLYNVVAFVIELMVVAVATPFLLIFVPMPTGLWWMVFASGVVCLLISVGLYVLVGRGMLSAVARTLRRIRLISQARLAKLEPKLRSVDDKLRLVEGARRRDRLLGIGAITLSRFTSMFISLSVVYVVSPGTLTVGFIAAYIVGGFAIYMVGTLVPMGLGVSEGGWYGLFRALGENPAGGVTMVLARRVTLILYAGIGLVLLTASETVKRARVRQAERAAAPPPEPAAVPAALPVPPTTPAQ